MEPIEIFPGPTASLDSPTAQKLLLGLHRALSFSDLWTALQRLFEALVPHDTMVMSVNYIDWRQETTSLRLTSANSRVLADRHAAWLATKEGSKFLQLFIERNKGIPCYRHSQAMPNVQSISRTPYYKHYMIPAGWRYSAHLLLWRGSEVETSFAFRRRSDQGDFSDHEMALLRALHPHVATAFERTRLFEGEHRRRNLLEQYYRAKPEAVILLDWNFEVLYSSQEAIALCVAWNLGPEKARFYTPKTMFSLPPEILRECKRIKPSWEQRRTETSDLERPAIAAEVKGERAGFSATITVRREGGSSLTKPLFVIRLLWTTEEKRAKGGLGRKLGSLTPAERNLAKLVCTGLSNKEIAARLRRTEGSVKVQLSGVFQKLRVGSRTKLIAALQ